MENIFSFLQKLLEMVKKWFFAILRGLGAIWMTPVIRHGFNTRHSRPQKLLRNLFFVILDVILWIFGIDT